MKLVIDQHGSIMAIDSEEGDCEVSSQAFAALADYFVTSRQIALSVRTTRVS
jgi:hypothetical protein